MYGDGDHTGAVERFRSLLRVPTVSRSDRAEREDAPFERFPALLAELYPRVHAALEFERVDDTGLLYRWPGREAGDAVVLLAHWDVVPADEPGWTHPPFDAVRVADAGGVDRIWGRGTIDDKGALVAILEAVDAALADGVEPAHDVYLSFGGDEEVQGSAAEAAVDLLASRGVRARLVLDEGGAVVEGQFPGVRAPTAVVGIAEKGIATVELVAKEPGGHAAHPPRRRPTATARLARAITRVSKRTRAKLPPPAMPMFRALGAHVGGALGFVFRHPRAFRFVLERALASGSDEADALLRTTRVVTRLQGSAAVNVLPESARATVNLRVAVGSTLDAELERIRRDVADPRIAIELVHGTDPSPVSPAEGPAWDVVAAALRTSHPDAIPVPYAMLGATDGRHFARISDCVYRFTPFALSRRDLAGLHALDESIRVDAWLAGIRFYRALLDLV